MYVATVSAIMGLCVVDAVAQTPATRPDRGPAVPQRATQQRPPTISPSGRQDRRPIPATPPLRFPGEALFNGRPPFLAGVVVDREDHVYQEGDKVRIRGIANHDANLYMIYHQADGASLLIFPNVVQRSSHVAAGKPILVPASERELRIRIQGPFGREVLQVLATLEPLKELNDLVGSTQQFPVVSPQLLGRIGKRLQEHPQTWTEHRVPIETVANQPLPPQRKADRVGLFIGIGKYLHPPNAPTHEELGHSAVVMHDLMLNLGGLDPQRTRLMMNEQATKRNIEEQITRWLPSVSKPGDTVFIYFSGHAGRIETADSDEPGRMESTIGPYDLSPGEANMTPEQHHAIWRETNITSQELARWMEELSGRQIVFILDTCHSGGLLRTKALGKDFFVKEAAGVKAVAQMNMVVLTACAEDEQSLFEGTPNTTMWFTYCLSQIMEKPDRPHPLTVQTTFADSVRLMRQLLHQGNAPREQEPQMTDTALMPIVLLR